MFLEGVKDPGQGRVIPPSSTLSSRLPGKQGQNAGNVLLIFTIWEKGNTIQGAKDETLD